MTQTTETMPLVTFQDGDKYGEPITNSKIVAEVFEMRHDNVLQAIENLKSDITPGTAGERLLKIQESFVQPEERRREFGEGAGKLISEPIRTQPPTAYDMELAKAYDKIVGRERNELDTDKCQFFKLTTYEVITGNGTVREFPMYEMNEDGFALLAMGFTGAKATMFKVRFIKEFNRHRKLVNDQLLLDSQKLHLIEDRHLWQEMDWRLQTLEAEKHEMSNRLTLLETKGTATQVRSDIRRGGFCDAANIFYPPVKVALKRLETASRQTSIEKMRNAVLYVREPLHKSMDKTVNVTSSYDLDLEAIYDEDTVRKYDERCLAEFAARFEKTNF